jgi:hypothetical protein
MADEGQSGRVPVLPAPLPFPGGAPKTCCDAASWSRDEPLQQPCTAPPPPAVGSAVAPTAEGSGVCVCEREWQRERDVCVKEMRGQDTVQAPSCLSVLLMVLPSPLMKSPP